VRFALLCWSLAEDEVQSLCARLKVPNEERDLAILGSRLRDQLKAGSSKELLAAARLAMPGFDSGKLEKALEAASAVDAGEVARRASAPAEIPGLLDHERKLAIEKGKK